MNYDTLFIAIILAFVALVTWELRRYAAPSMVGKYVLAIDVRGCMAEVDVLLRVGIIERVVDQRDIYGPDAESLVVAVCRTVGDPDDSVREFTAPVDCLQLIEGGNGYFWRR